MSLIIICLAIISRIFPHPPNFAPIGALALFGGAYFKGKYAILMVFLIMVISDYLLLYVNPFSAKPINLSTFYLPNTLIHTTTVFVYGSFLVYFLIGKWITTHKSISRILTGTLLASLQFFLITNFGVWATGAYSRGIDGLTQSYIMGLPFFKWTILGDLFYSTLFFSAYELGLKTTHRLRLSLNNLFA